MNNNYLRKIAILILSVISLNICAAPRVWAISDYTQESINPAIVPDPLVYSFFTCVDKYGFCACELIGTGVDISDYDSDNDNVISSLDMRQARNLGIFTDEQMGTETFLACHYSPPSPGPYEREFCLFNFGEEDCVCPAATRGLYHAVCYSKLVIQHSPEPIPVPEIFCEHKTVGGLQNCVCNTSDLDSYLSGENKCYVMPEKSDNTWQCESGAIRIMSGSKYTCRTKDGTVFHPDCCPGDSGCVITSYDTGLGDISTAMQGANIALSLYSAYAGYASMAGGTASVAGFAGSLASTASELGVEAAIDSYGNYASMGMANNPALSALSTSLFWVGVAIMVYQYFSELYMNCTPGEFELICKHDAGLCIYTGKECVDDGPFGCNKEVKVYMCYSSQVAKIVNEYGLAQVYDPGCHRENCDAARASDSCGCRDAYTTDGRPTHTRHHGFTISEFQRLSFSEIPISETLVATLTGNTTTDDFAAVPLINDPSLLLTNEGEGSTQEQVPDPGDGAIGDSQNLGGCTYNPDGSVKWPIDAADFQIFDHSVGVPTVSYTDICVAAPIPESGHTYVAQMSQNIEMANRLLLPDPSTANATVSHINTCENAYIAAGWGNIGSFTNGRILHPMANSVGLNCLDPIHMESHFYEPVPFYNDSYLYQQFEFSSNTIDDPQQTVTLPERYWYNEMVEYQGVDVPATHYREFWVYWLPDSGLKRGEWIEVEEKCILSDTSAPDREICDQQYQTCFDSCGNNDTCKQTCADDHTACLAATDLSFLAPPPMPRTVYVDVYGMPAYVPPDPLSIRYVYIDAAGHPDFARPQSPVYTVVDVTGHAELTPPAIPREITVDVRTVGSLPIPADYDPDTGESLASPGTFFVDDPTCQNWYLQTFHQHGIDVYLTNKCEPVGTGKLITDADYYIASVPNQSTCPPGYTLDVNCWNDGQILYNASGYNASTGTYFINDPICQNWYQTNVADRNLDYTLANNCTISPNNPPAVNHVHTFSRTCPQGFTAGLDCFEDSPMGRDVYGADGVAIYEGGSMETEQVCIDWYNQLVAMYDIQADLGIGCFLEPDAQPAGPTSYYTTQRTCATIPGFTDGVDCFPNGLPVYDVNGYDPIQEAYFRDESVCQDWFTTYIADLNILATPGPDCRLNPDGTQFEVSTGICPVGFTQGVNCFQLGSYLYDPVTGYSERLGQYFDESPVCANWFQNEIVGRNIEATLARNCTITSLNSVGDNFFTIDANVCPPDTTEDTNCFCQCPAMADDMLNDPMICAKPNRTNLIQRFVAHNSINSAFDAYYGRPDVQLRYELYLP